MAIMVKDDLDKIIEEYEQKMSFEEWFEGRSSQPLSIKEENNMTNLNWRDFSGAIVSAVLSAVLAYVATVTNLATLDWKQIGIIALIAGLGSLAKQLGTTGERNFAGAVPVR